MRNLEIVAACWALALGCAGLAGAAEEKKAVQPADPDKEATFELREVSAFQTGRSPYAMLLGQRAECGAEPDKQVKAYPQLKSKHPLYGKVKFGANWTDPKAGTEYHFVIDESGERPAQAKPAEAKPVAPKSGEDKPADKKPAKSSSLLKALASSLSGPAASTAPPRAEAKPVKTPITYDRLYFDANRDLDLANDPVLLPMKDPPAGADPFGSRAKQTVVYDFLAIPFDHGPGFGVRPFRVLPRLNIQESEGKDYSTLSFVATVARQGRIRIGSREYDALLAQPHAISGRYDGAGAEMTLTPVGSSRPLDSGWGLERVGAMHRVDGKYYTASVTPLGDKLTVKPYRGDLGVLKLGPGKRDLKKLSLDGSLYSETSAVAVGETDGLLRLVTPGTAECRLPVGDYLPGYMRIEYGRLRLSLSCNYHSDGRPRDMERPRVYAIQIRKDKPFVLDFSNKPEVIFASPAKDQTLKPGDTLRVAAVLTDPGLDIMIRGLNDSGRKQKEVYKLADGKEHSYERPLSLDPRVTITNSSGKQVAEGKMPFG